MAAPVTRQEGHFDAIQMPRQHRVGGGAEGAVDPDPLRVREPVDLIDAGAAEYAKDGVHDHARPDRKKRHRRAAIGPRKSGKDEISRIDICNINALQNNPAAIIGHNGPTSIARRQLDVCETLEPKDVHGWVEIPDTVCPVAGLENKYICLGTAKQLIIAGSAAQGVLPGLAFQSVVPIATFDFIISETAKDPIHAIVPGQGVVSSIAKDPIIAAISANLVISVTAA